MNWTKPRFTRADVDRCGKRLCNELWSENREQVLDVVDNWRSSHNYPLHALMMTLRSKVASVDQAALTAQRLKRLTSITAKLSREPSMQLSQMQDIGGCRAVVKDIHCLKALVSKFEKGKLRCWELHRPYDYVARPKPDGYRSVHLVYKYVNT